MRHQTLEHRFVRNIPRDLEPGVLYISMEYATAAHQCCCGCGERVVTPFTPTDWRMTFDGESISLQPSVGNWNQPCRSHYFIQKNQVLEASSWSPAQIEAERRRDKQAKAAHYASASLPREPNAGPRVVAESIDAPRREGSWSRVKRWFTT